MESDIKNESENILFEEFSKVSLRLGKIKKIEPNASILSPRGKILENGMPRFFRRLSEGVFDLEDLRIRSHELADFIQKCSLQVRGI